jgi:hypothetical protein
VSDDDVGRLDVEMEDLAPVHVSERGTNMYGDAQSVRDAQPSPITRESAQGWPVEIFQQHVWRLPGAEKADNIRMRELGEDPGLAHPVLFRAIELAYHRAPGFVVPHEING